MARHIWIYERVAGLLIAALVAAIYVAGGFERPELMTYDWRLRAFPGTPRSDIVIVGIDSPSLKALDTWPWPRSVYAALVDRLTQANARVIAFDVDFSTPRDPDADQLFARAVDRSQRVVLAAFDDHRTLEGGAVVEYASLPYPALLNAAGAIGSINFPIDADGAIRRAPIATPMLGAEGWSFSVQTTRAYLNAIGTPVRRTVDGALELGDHRANVGETNEFFVRFTGGPWTVPVVSFVDVLNGTVPASRFSDKIVLVGATSLDLQDFRITPFHGAMAGVEIQANAIATILSGRSQHRLPLVAVLGWMLAILLWWTLLLLALRVWRWLEVTRRALIICLAGSFTLALIVGSVIVAYHWLLVVDVAPLMATAVGQMVTSLIAGYVFAERRLEFQRENIEALYRMGDETRERASLDRLTDLLFAQARHLLGVDRLALELWTADDALTREWRSRPDEGDVPPISARVYQELVVRVRSTGMPVTATNLERHGHTSKRIRPLGASLFVPFVAHNRVIGILQVHRERALPFHEGEARTLLTLATQAALNIENGRLLDDVRTLFQRSLEAFSTALDFKDNDTGGHSQRVSLYAREIASRMGIDGPELDAITQGALLHDIGKIGVPDRILLKPGKLTDEEWVAMREHPETGYRMLKTIQIPDPIAIIVRQHHERFDGTGYPGRLKGTSIDIGARIFTLVDYYDALTNDRPYRKAQPIDLVMADIRHLTGSHFDPHVVDTFFAIPDDMLGGLRAQVEQTLIERRAA
ncbi:MAG: CHASE2 domain-containing protein [Nitrospirota bacterium]